MQIKPMCMDSVCTKLCGCQSLVKKIQNADMKKKIKKLSLRIVFIEMTHERNFTWTYATQYVQICLQILKASKFETFLQSDRKEINPFLANVPIFLPPEF